MEITISYSAISKIVELVTTLTRECPLKKYSRNALNAAIEDLNYLSYESNVREGLNRALGHLESAYHNFEPSRNFILEWTENIDRIYWDQRTYQNDMRIIMAVIHYALGNVDRARIWLNELTTYGWIHVPSEALELLGLSNPSDLFKRIFNTNEDIYAQLQLSARLTNSDVYGLNDPEPSSFDYLP